MVNELSSSQVEGTGRGSRARFGFTVGFCIVLPMLFVVFVVVAVRVDEYHHFKSPPAEALPMPPGITISADTESCGSGGCPIRQIVLAGTGQRSAGLRAALEKELLAAGWRKDPSTTQHSFQSADGELVVDVLDDRSQLTWFSDHDRDHTHDPSTDAVVDLSYVDSGVDRW